MSSLDVNSSGCAIGHDDLLNSPDINATSSTSKVMKDVNNIGRTNTKSKEQSALRDVDLLMSDLLSL